MGKVCVITTEVLTSSAFVQVCVVMAKSDQANTKLL